MAPIDEKKDGNMRTAISAEATKKLPGGILPVIKKTDFQRECIENALNLNTFMRSLSKDQFNKVCHFSFRIIIYRQWIYFVLFLLKMTHDFKNNTIHQNIPTA